MSGCGDHGRSARGAKVPLWHWQCRRCHGTTCAPTGGPHAPVPSGGLLRRCAARNDQLFQALRERQGEMKRPPIAPPPVLPPPLLPPAPSSRPNEAAHHAKPPPAQPAQAPDRSRVGESLPLRAAGLADRHGRPFPSRTRARQATRRRPSSRPPALIASPATTPYAATTPAQAASGRTEGALRSGAVA